ncbi:CoA pyrophosphatase [Caulobacter sp. CCUG 60055]|uniref:CoA pyrophosphatase n=1 Tax=Caulobacter sp. CCUG 60055 TaxID=2100090 RepID=UPI001FA807E3|nr:CoA pyrophosphatase [Caulobacter sp. CCUG 60055]MBQ1543856.1 CoA pyrophosphatase [Caulobacteraceae bacterium]MCI3180682.1 CoA pyrophosphatase [Caulobacter sp. CCUG 60055]
MSPDAPPGELRDWIAGRLDPLDAHHPGRAAAHSDYDLNPELRRGELASLRAAAVLVPLVEREHGLNVILTRRSDALRSHTGQIAFPGGGCDPGETPVETALREAWEEIGLESSFARPLGLLSGYQTVTGFYVTPVVGWIEPGFTLKANPDEVADVFEAPFEFLMNPANHQRQSRETPGGGRRYFYAMPYEQWFIWGATAGMLRGLYERLYGEAVA